MSGGRFEYNQFRIGDIADSIQEEIDRSGRKRTPEEIEDAWDNDEYNYKYPDEVIEKFEYAVKLLREAQIYAHRIDWLLSGDDGESTFLKRLDDDLEQMRNTIN